MLDEKNVKISVIIPVYNTPEGIIRQCIESILKQSFTDFELVLVDDGSTEDCLSVLHEYESFDSRVKVLRQSNSYAGNARNNGMSHSCGDYLCFFDSDDYCEPDFLKILYEIACDNQSDVVICEENFYDIDLDILIPKRIPEDKEQEGINYNKFSALDIPDGIFQISNGWPWDKLFKRSFIVDNGLMFAPSRTANDGYFVFMAMSLATVISKTDQRLVIHRMGGDTSLSNTRETTWHDGLTMLFDIKRSLVDKGVFSFVEKSFLNYSLYYVFWALENMAMGAGKRKLYAEICGEVKNILNFEQHDSSYFNDPSLYHRYLYAQKNSIEKYIDNFELSFPYELVPHGSRIVLYAAGKFGKLFYRELSKNNYAKIVLWIDQRFTGLEKKTVNGVSLGGIDCLSSVEYDYIVFTLTSKTIYEKMKSILISHEVPEEKVIFCWKGSVN